MIPRTEIYWFSTVFALLICELKVGSVFLEQNVHCEMWSSMCMWSCMRIPLSVISLCPSKTGLFGQSTLGKLFKFHYCCILLLDQFCCVRNISVSVILEMIQFFKIYYFVFMLDSKLLKALWLIKWFSCRLVCLQLDVTSEKEIEAVTEYLQQTVGDSGML